MRVDMLIYGLPSKRVSEEVTHMVARPGVGAANSRPQHGGFAWRLAEMRKQIGQIATGPVYANSTITSSQSMFSGTLQV